MSYNPAFVGDEPQTNAAGGVNLSSELPAGTGPSSDPSNGGIRLTSFKQLNQIQDLNEQKEFSQQLNAPIEQISQQQQINNDDCKSKATKQQQRAHKKQKQKQPHNKSSNQKGSTSFLLSTTSSSLSLLVDNPALSSLATTATNAGTASETDNGNAQIATTCSSTTSSTSSAESSTATASSYSPSISSSSQASSLVSSTTGPTSSKGRLITTTATGALSGSSSSQCAAVECRDLRYSVGRGKSQKIILHDINVTVPEGSIYGLLGPSGCGKTTMLRCVVGRIKPRSGVVRVLGYRPNESGSQIPGPAIGYMPQEISVYEDFTINETLTYFGKINKMKQDLIDARIAFLLNFLDLPGKNRLIASLSGGQKRRVSLAAALVHSPPLLILDEPTVGVDPLLRQSIWKHLVTLAQTEKITVVITTHYIEEARQANVVGLMRHGKLLAEDSPDNLMSQHGMDNLENVFLKLCISDSSRKAAKLAASNGLESVVSLHAHNGDEHNEPRNTRSRSSVEKMGHQMLLDENGCPILQTSTNQQSFMHSSYTNHHNHHHHHHHNNDRMKAKKKRQFPSIFALTENEHTSSRSYNLNTEAVVATTPIQQQQQQHTSISMEINSNDNNQLLVSDAKGAPKPLDKLVAPLDSMIAHKQQQQPDFIVNRNNLRSMVPGTKYQPKKVSASTWLKSLLAVIWKNYIRLKRNPPVLIFEFILPAVQVILFCLCIGGDPFDVPLAVVNDELIPQASRFFLDAIDKKAIRQVPFTNLSDAIESVRRGETWGAIHIPDRYTQYLQERLTHPADITNETLVNATINIYPDLTNLHLALAMENTFREAFIKFAKDTLNMFGYDPEAAELPIRVEQPVYGTLKRNGYLEFMAPGVVISITYVMATGLTALAFILEKRDGLLERSLVSGVTTSQILLAHASVQVLVMIIQIALVLAFTFIVFEIPSHGPFFWVVLLILLQGCTGMSFGLLVSALCEEENTAVMMLVGTFYTNLILAGIIWPLEAMPRWLRWFSYAQPQTLPTETLRNILSRGWGISESGVYVGFLVTIGWLIVFLLAAGLFMRYSK